MSITNFINKLVYGGVQNSTPNNTLKVWASGDPHLNNSIVKIGYNSIQVPYADMDAIGYDWDLAISVGDWDSNQRPPSLNPADAAYENSVSEGEAVRDALASSPNHTRAETYCINGNHDCGILNHDWIERYIDILGTQPLESGVINSERPFPMTFMAAGRWDSYYITIGNLIILMISDRNEVEGVFGRGNIDPSVFPPDGTNGTVNGGYPSGCISIETWEWMKSVILSNTDKNIWVCTHQNPRNTTIGTPDGDSELWHSTTTGEFGAASIYTLYDDTGGGNHDIATDAILDFFEANTQHTVSLWMCGHTHVRVGEVYNNRGVTYQKHGVVFQNVCSLSQTFVRGIYGRVQSKSWTIEVVNKTVKLRCYVHLPVSIEQDVPTANDLPPNYQGDVSTFYRTLDDGHWYCWDGANWLDQGVIYNPPKGFVESESVTISMPHKFIRS